MKMLRRLFVSIFPMMLSAMQTPTPQPEIQLVALLTQSLADQTAALRAVHEQQQQTVAELKKITHILDKLTFLALTPSDVIRREFTEHQALYAKADKQVRALRERVMEELLSRTS